MYIKRRRKNEPEYLSPEEYDYIDRYKEDGKKAHLWRIEICDKYIDDPIIQIIKFFCLTFPYDSVLYCRNIFSCILVNMKGCEEYNKIFSVKYRWITGI